MPLSPNQCFGSPVLTVPQTTFSSQAQSMVFSSFLIIDSPFWSNSRDHEGMGAGARAPSRATACMSRLDTAHDPQYRTVEIHL